MNRDLNYVYKPLKEIIEKALEVAKNRGLGAIITSVWRSSSEQDALYAQGRKSLTEVNTARSNVGLSKITQEQNVKVTWTRKSYHSCEPKSMAIDFCIIKDKKAVWDIKADMNFNEIPDYEEFANICKSLDSNIEWGGEWGDYCHIQWQDGININQDEKNKTDIIEKEKQNLICRLISLLFKRFTKD